MKILFIEKAYQDKMKEAVEAMKADGLLDDFSNAVGFTSALEEDEEATSFVLNLLGSEEGCYANEYLAGDWDIDEIPWNEFIEFFQERDENNGENRIVVVLPKKFIAAFFEEVDHWDRVYSETVMFFRCLISNEED